jgi:hypothetical protein
MRQLRDRIISALLKNALQKFFREYGTLVAAHLDSRQKNLTLEMQLKGENTSTQIMILGYAFTREQGQHYLVAASIQTSREWLTALLRNYGAALRLEIPQKYRLLLRWLV